VLLLLVSFLASARERVLLVSTDYPPYFSENLPEQGTVAAIARAAFDAAGYDVAIEFRPWARLIAETQAGQYDAIVAVWFKADRLSYLAYSDPLVDTKLGFYGRRDRPIDVTALAKLKPFTIGTVRGYANPPSFDAAQLNTEDAVDDITNLRKLAAGRLDLIVIDRSLADYLVRKELPGVASVVEWRNPAIEVMPLYLGVARKRAGYAQVLSAFNRGLADIRRNGEYERIVKRLPLAQ
jgi:polar amino acid transport system substrate-binding protein